MDAALVATAGTIAAAVLGWVWSSYQDRRERERLLREAQIEANFQQFMRWYTSDPADTRPLGPLPDDVTRALTEDE